MPIQFRKLPSSVSIEDPPLEFGKFENMHFELMEVKQKLKAGLPLISIAPKPQNILKYTPPVREAPLNSQLADVFDDDDPRISSRDRVNRLRAPPEIEHKELESIVSPGAYNIPDNPRPPTLKLGKEEVSSDESEGLSSDDEDFSALMSLKAGTGASAASVTTSELLKPSKPAATARNVNIENFQSILEDHAEDVANGSDNEVDGDSEDDDESEKEIDTRTPEQIESDKREELEWKFKMLRRKYKDVEVPNFDEHSSVLVMEKTYKSTLKEVYLDNVSKSYKKYLIAAFFGFEFACCTFLNIDMKGFAKSQLSSMKTYDRLLIELGEKSYDRWEEFDIPVEAKLIGLVLFNACLFILVKKSGNGEMAGFLMSVIGDESTIEDMKPPSFASSNETSNGSEKRKMRGPSVQFD